MNLKMLPVLAALVVVGCSSKGAGDSGAVGVDTASRTLGADEVSGTDGDAGTAGGAGAGTDGDAGTDGGAGTDTGAVGTGTDTGVEPSTDTGVEPGTDYSGIYQGDLVLWLYSDSWTSSIADCALEAVVDADDNMDGVAACTLSLSDASGGDGGGDGEDGDGDSDEGHGDGHEFWGGGATTVTFDFLGEVDLAGQVTGELQITMDFLGSGYTVPLAITGEIVPADRMSLSFLGELDAGFTTAELSGDSELTRR